ncbi:MAG: 2OG-Fe(II) oxygenase [Microcoleaceae cyanobacterium MO_207.B10]|nr:2OG-Fe(II) oxygenase [Microcoleaceae cyanobacterium MO_207.B10]
MDLFSTIFPEQIVDIDTQPTIFRSTENNHQEEIWSAQYVQIDNFLSPGENQKILKSVIAQESKFIPTKHGGKFDLETRQSKVLPLSTNDCKYISKKIDILLPDILTKLGISHLSIDKFEGQITAHNDGDFYRIHKDNGTPNLSSRKLTYLYYFYWEPKCFIGGELVLYDYKKEWGVYVKAETFKTIQPQNNSIVFFRSDFMHEVLPVVCPSQAFVDSRFTINGWIHDSFGRS